MNVVDRSPIQRRIVEQATTNQTAIILDVQSFSRWPAGCFASLRLGPLLLSGLMLAVVTLAFNSSAIAIQATEPLKQKDRAKTERTLKAKTQTAVKAPSTAELRSVVLKAFVKTRDGWSCDEVLLNSDLNEPFVEACRQQLPNVDAAEFNWTLINMRKAGHLKGIKTTKRNHKPLHKYSQIAEISARLVHDRHQVSTDRMMAVPKFRAEFDREVQRIDPELDLYCTRKAAFQLRKQRRLKPELIARIADWGRAIESFSVERIRNEPSLVPDHPGIYIFRDQSGYLYIGQSENLQKRLREHLDESSNFALATYLGDQGNENITIEIHAFAPDSRAKETMIRRAYESELIASRKPRFNIQP
jgi:predicted GIY-YIG superfamily endonuclease